MNSGKAGRLKFTGCPESDNDSIHGIYDSNTTKGKAK